MLDLIRLVRSRYQSVLNHMVADDAQGPVYQNTLFSLFFAEACLQKSELTEENPDHPIQIALLGPTQAGKSTVANLLLGNNFAGVSPLAGFTVHPQGFCVAINGSDMGWLDQFFSQYQRHAVNDLPSDRYSCFALTETTRPSATPLPPCVIWDTPDFDSIEAEEYRESVLRTAALADVIMLVVSKDKYADQSVWEMMALLEPLAQPTVVCVNKMTPSAKTVVVGSLLEKWGSTRSDSPLATHTLSYADIANLAETVDPELIPLLADLKKATGKIKRKRHGKYTRQLLNKHWPTWFAPVKAENKTVDEWFSLVDICVEEGLTLYKRDYLNHPQHNETFQRALAELLTLLEIPGLASAFNITRRVVTWPVRQIMKLGGSARGSGDRKVNPTQEVMILNQIAEHMFLHLSELVLDKIEESPDMVAWWNEISRLLTQQKEDLLNRFQGATEQYHAAFLPEIEKAAQHLFRKLESQPVVLNSLRATRITTDAAAVALAVKTGGIGVQDFVITPAVLSITSLLTEGALGGFMNKVSADLKKSQYQTVSSQVFDNLREQLGRLLDKLDQSDKFNISKQMLADAETELKNKRHGLQFF